jgi:5,5'-dehydrodivanillate O-demethylase
LDERTQEALTRVGPGTPMGELLRRYWQPVAAASEFPGRPTKRVRILGEDLVLFRHAGGWGLVQERCPHRGASLAYGVCEPEGIRCPYHGWKFAPDGRCLDVPPEPPDSPLLRTRVAAYPARELGGLVFAYLGPLPAPVLPRWDLLVWDNALRDIGQATLPCNWLQIMENSVDPYHTEWLHGHHLADVQKRQGREEGLHYLRPHVKVGFDVFPFGIVKRRVLEGGSEKDDDWTTGHPLLFPNTLRVGEHGRARLQIRVPIDDTHTWHLWYSCYRFDGIEMPPQEAIPLYDVPWRDERGEFLVDFVDGGDIMAWVTQGRIADRTRETLGSSDRGIALYRRLLLEQAERVRAGEDPLGVLREEHAILELPQERNKYGGGAQFLLKSIENGHGRHSPLKEQVRALLLGGA